MILTRLILELKLVCRTNEHKHFFFRTKLKLFMTYLLHYNLSQNGQIPSILEIFCKKTLSQKLSKYHQFYIGSLNYLNITPYSLNFLKPSLPTFSQLTLSSLTFSISLSLSQSCYQLTLTFSISLSNSPTCSQSPF